MRDEKYQIFLRGKVVAICEAILSEEIGIISGSRKLMYLSHLVSEDFDEDFRIFIGVDSETDHLPIDWERKNWSVEALKIKDLEIAEYEKDFRDNVFSACKKLIERFNMHENN